MGYQLLDRTILSMSNEDLSMTDVRSRIGSNTLPNSGSPCSSMGKSAGDFESHGESIR